MDYSEKVMLHHLILYIGNFISVAIIERPNGSPDIRDLVFASQSLVHRPHNQNSQDWSVQTTVKKLTLVKDIEQIFN